MTFDPNSAVVTCDCTQGSLYPSPIQLRQSMWIQWPFFQKLKSKVNNPLMTFHPKSVEVTCVTLPKGHCVKVPWKYIKVCGYSDLFLKTWTKGHWPLHDLWPPHLLRSHVWLYLRIIMFKSHRNTSMYVDTVINFVKLQPRLPHTTYIHTTYYVQNEWSHSLFLNYVQARQ